MAELTSQERLQPSLLDRLTDDNPQQHREARERRVLNLRQLREGVIRDLAWLLNTSNLDSVQDLDDYPDVKDSVLNYGMPHLAGNTASGVEARTLERRMKEAIVRFEPRILKKSVRVRITVADDQMDHNALTLEIQGELWAQPVPERLFLKTEVDLETGHISVQEHAGGID